MRIVAGILCAGLCCLQATAAGISDTYIPSEDELYQAYIAGEIDFDEYQLMLEAIQYGIDPSFFDLEDLLSDSLAIQNTGDPAVRKKRGRNESLVALRLQYHVRLEDPSPSRTTSALKVRPSGDWLFSMRTREELTGRERCVERSLTYMPDSSAVRRVQIGTFNRKFGLGSAVGCRGKLFSMTDREKWESLLYPDYGGFNGMIVDLHAGKVDMSALTSYNQNDEYSLRTTALHVGRYTGALRPSLTMAMNSITNRATDSTVSDIKAALSLLIRSHGSEVKIEYCLQDGLKSAYGTFLADAKLKTAFGRVNLNGWTYDPDYLTISSGGRSAAIRQQVGIEEIGLDFTDRRSGQTGIQAGVVGELSQNVSLTTKALAAWLHADSSLLQARSELDWNVASPWHIGLQYLFSRSERGARDTLYHRVRAIAEYQADRLQFRTTVGQSLPESGKGAFSWLADIRVSPVAETEFQFWSHLARFIDGRINYWSIFARVKQQLTESFEVATKISERYSAGSSDKHQLAFGVELIGAI